MTTPNLSPPPVLEHGVVRLRPPCEQDKQDRLAYGRDPEFVRMVGGDIAKLQPLTVEKVEGWYKEVSELAHGWVIEVAGRCIGHARLHSLNERDRRARYAIGIYAPQARGHGYGTTATRLVLGYAFETLALHRVDLRVLTFNHRAIACYEKCGFVREGIERESALVDGVWCDDLMMSILEHEYRRTAGEKW
jgi:[ribosomal protein S5]-alanine N-acetyltransferase